MKTFSEMSLESGIPASVLRNRIKVLGWEIERALNTPVKKLYDGKSVQQHASECNICYTTMNARLKSMTVTEARDTPLRRKRGVRNNPKTRTEVRAKELGYNPYKMTRTHKITIANKAVSHYKREYLVAWASLDDVPDDILDSFIHTVLKAA